MYADFMNECDFLLRDEHQIKQKLPQLKAEVAEMEIKAQKQKEGQAKIQNFINFVNRENEETKRRIRECNILLQTGINKPSEINAEQAQPTHAVSDELISSEPQPPFETMMSESDSSCADITTEIETVETLETRTSEDGSLPSSSVQISLSKKKVVPLPSEYAEMEVV
jgi:SMC interacting uncharacterized protein involved in chromosome segregation